jgi:hypothetical protein
MGVPEIYALWYVTGKYEYVMALPIVVLIGVLNIMFILGSVPGSICFVAVLMIDIACIIAVAYYFLSK